MKIRNRFSISTQTHQHLAGKPQSTLPYMLDTLSGTALSRTSHLSLTGMRRPGSHRSLYDLAQVVS